MIHVTPQPQPRQHGGSSCLCVYMMPLMMMSSSTHCCHVMIHVTPQPQPRQHGGSSCLCVYMMPLIMMSSATNMIRKAACSILGRHSKMPMNSSIYQFKVVWKLIYLSMHGQDIMCGISISKVPFEIPHKRSNAPVPQLRILSASQYELAFVAHCIAPYWFELHRISLLPLSY